MVEAVLGRSWIEPRFDPVEDIGTINQNGSPASVGFLLDQGKADVEAHVLDFIIWLARGWSSFHQVIHQPVCYPQATM